MSIQIRPATEDDRAFIMATWLRGLYYGHDFYGSIAKSVFFKEYQQILSSLLDKKLVKVDVACLSEDETCILGYAVYEPLQALHYVFVKEAWRRQGLAKRLVPEGPLDVTHLTKLGDRIRRKEGLLFNPFKI